MNKYIALILISITNIVLLFLVVTIKIPQALPVSAQNLQCSFNQANCSWNAVTGATGYQVTIREVDTNTVVTTQSVASSVTRLVFNVTQNMTYECSVVAINACGQGPAGTTQVLCAVDAGSLPTATPTPSRAPTISVSVAPSTAPTSLPAGISPIGPTNTPPPTLPPAGTVENTLIFGAGAVALIIVGGLLFIL